MIEIYKTLVNYSLLLEGVCMWQRRIIRNRSHTRDACKIIIYSRTKITRTRLDWRIRSSYRGCSSYSDSSYRVYIYSLTSYRGFRKQMYHMSNRKGCQSWWRRRNASSLCFKIWTDKTLYWDFEKAFAKSIDCTTIDY